jgi:hypothetical protein
MKQGTVLSERTLDAPAADVGRVLAGAAGDLLQFALAAPDRAAADDGTFLADLQGALGSHVAAKRVRIGTGRPRRVGEGMVVRVHWRADPLGGLFPRFAGSFEVEPLVS